MRLLLRTAAILVASLLCTAYSAADPLPRTVLVLDQSIPHTEYFGKLFASLQSTLKAGSNSPITIYSERLEYSYFKSPEYGSLQTFIKEKYRSRPIGVIVADGFDALQFAVSLRTELDPAIPIVFSSIDDDSAGVLNLPRNASGTTVRTTIQHALITAKAFVPGLKRIAIVGDPLEQQTFRRHYKKELLIIDKDVELINLTGLPMNDLRKRVAALPKDAAILYTTLSVGADGARYDPNDALALVAEVANRPIVIDLETRLGHGGAGGFLLLAAQLWVIVEKGILRACLSNIDSRSRTNAQS